MVDDTTYCLPELYIIDVIVMYRSIRIREVSFALEKSLKKIPVKYEIIKWSDSERAAFCYCFVLNLILCEVAISYQSYYGGLDFRAKVWESFGTTFSFDDINAVERQLTHVLPMQH